MRIERTRRLALLRTCYRHGWTRLPYPPLLVNLEPTNRCNLRCPICPVSQNSGKGSTVARGFMSLALFRRIVDELATFRPDVALNMGGESTLHPELPTMIAELKRAKLFVFLDTNATRLTPELSADLIDAGLDEIVFSLDGHDAATYAQIRKRGDFDATVGNVRAFLELRRRRGTAGPRAIVKNIDWYEPGRKPVVPASFRRLFADMPPDEYRATWADYWPGTHKDLLTEQYAVQPYSESEYSPCINLWKKLPIAWDGMVNICCLDLNRTTNLGRVQELGLLKIWNGSDMRELRRAHRRGEQAQLELCRSCVQIRRPADRAEMGLRAVREDRFTPWNREPQRPADATILPVHQSGADHGRPEAP